jgi:ABC-type branched-subunit amino acid transport system permease subunit
MPPIPHRWLVSAVFPLFVAVCATVVYLVVHIENQAALAAIVAAAAAAWAIAARTPLFGMIEQGAGAAPWRCRLSILVASGAVIIALREDNFGLLMLATVMLYATVCVGLTIQLGYAGVTNFCASAFFGCGGYTAAVLGQAGWSGVPDLAVVALGGCVAVAVGAPLILPVLRTRGHYAALTTLAFGEMFGLFLNANDLLGGPQGLKLSPFTLLGWDFSNDITPFGIDFSFYTNYALLALALLAGAIGLAGLLDRSWIGVWFDVVRLDETVASVFGLRIAHWKILAFTLGNALAGMAGVVYAKMVGFIAPNNFTLGDSLIMVSIVILGGTGNRWGVLPAALIVILLPEKLQFIQEYRLLLFACAVIAILTLRPAGLLPRRARTLVAAPPR